MDGVRGYWDGQKLLSKRGEPIMCPDWFTSNLPTTVTLDGELWMGKGTTHEHSLKILNSKSSDWTEMGYYVFDIPCSGTYEERMKQMESLKPLLPSHVKIVENTKCMGAEHLRQCLLNTVTAQGEGLMLRKPLTQYEKG